MNPLDPSYSTPVMPVNNTESPTATPFEITDTVRPPNVILLPIAPPLPGITIAAPPGVNDSFIRLSLSDPVCVDAST